MLGHWPHQSLSDQLARTIGVAGSRKLIDDVQVTFLDALIWVRAPWRALKKAMASNLRKAPVLYDAYVSLAKATGEQRKRVDFKEQCLLSIMLLPGMVIYDVS